MMCVVQVWVGGTKSPDLGIEGEALTPEVVGRQPSPMGYLISDKAARYVLDRGGHQGAAMAPGPSRYDNRSESFPTTPPIANRESPPSPRSPQHYPIQPAKSREGGRRIMPQLRRWSDA